MGESTTYFSWKLVFVFFVSLTGFSCSTKVYPDEKLEIDPVFLSLFNSILQKDTIRFTSSTGRNKSFVITKIDSIIRNEKGWFINELPYKLLRFRCHEIGKDTVRLERENEVFVNKYPATGESSICIKFNNFYWSKDSILPELNHDTLIINKKKFTDYYLFETSLRLKDPDDVKILYMNVTNGFLAFKAHSGELWVNED